MQVDAMGYFRDDDWSVWISEATPEEVAAYYEGFTAGLLSALLPSWSNGSNDTTADLAGARRMPATC